MDGLAGTIGRPVLTSAGIEPHHFVVFHSIQASYSRLPALKKGLIC